MRSNTTTALTRMVIDGEISNLPTFIKNHPRTWYVPGGADIDPSLYGEECTYSHVFNSEFDKVEAEVVHTILRCEMPMVAICRGQQLLAAVTGGTLYQDIFVELNTNHSHGPIILDPQSVVHSVFNSHNLHANSLHHQSVKTLGDGWLIGAYAYDGVVESIYHPDMPWVVSTQWHPEMIGWQLAMVNEYLQEFLW